MTEDLHHFLSGEHLLHETVHVTEVGLLCIEELRGSLSQCPCGVDHHKRHEDRKDGEWQTQHNHTGEGKGDGDERGKEVGHRTDHLAQRIDIVGIYRHGVAVGMGVEIFDGQLLHVTEHIDTEAFQGALTDIDH